jgi:hypothetical protein
MTDGTHRRVDGRMIQSRSDSRRQPGVAAHRRYPRKATAPQPRRGCRGINPTRPRAASWPGDRPFPRQPLRGWCESVDASGGVGETPTPPAVNGHAFGVETPACRACVASKGTPVVSGNASGARIRLDAP